MNDNIKNIIIVMISYIPLFTIMFLFLKINPLWFLSFFAGTSAMVFTWNFYDFLQKKFLKEKKEVIK